MSNVEPRRQWVPSVYFDELCELHGIAAGITPGIFDGIAKELGISSQWAKALYHGNTGNRLAGRGMVPATIELHAKALCKLAEAQKALRRIQDAIDAINGTKT